MLSATDIELRQFVNSQWALRGRIVGYIGLAFSFFLLAYDWALYPEVWMQTSLVRAVQAVTIIALLIASLKEKWWHFAPYYVTAGVLVFIAGVDIVLHIQGAQATTDRAFAYTATTFVIFYLLPVQRAEGAIYLAATYASYFLCGHFWGYPPNLFAAPYLIQAGIVVSVGIIGNRVFLKTKREEIEANARLRERTDELARAKLALEKTLEELRASQAALSRAEGLAAVSEFVNGVAHEINNPMASARSLMETLAEDIEILRRDGPAAVRQEDLIRSLDGARAEIDRARTLIREVRTLSQEVQNSPDSVDLRQLLREVINEARTGSAATASIQMGGSEEPGPLVIRAHYARLRRVFLNLLDNAIAAEQKAGHTPDISIRLELASGRVNVTVADHGTGIQPDIQEKIFQPFFTTRRTEHRPGLGLYIAHEIVRSLGGRITVVSAVGEGSSFQVDLPVERTAA